MVCVCDFLDNVPVHVHSGRIPGRAECSEAEAGPGVHQHQSGWRRTESKFASVAPGSIPGLNSPRFAMLKGIVWSAWPMRCLDTTGGPTPSLSRTLVRNGKPPLNAAHLHAVVVPISDV